MSANKTPIVRKTFALHEPTARALDALVEAGRARSATSLIEQLILREAKLLEYERSQAELERMYAEIYADPAYRDEQLALEAIFAPALMDGLEFEKQPVDTVPPTIGGCHL
ncbi:MAG TPA: hypothetical protein VH599_16775 [Ktedonobacterales bacterium]|jgi:hypothetical protein